MGRGKNLKNGRPRLGAWDVTPQQDPNGTWILFPYPRSMRLAMELAHRPYP